MRRSFAQPHRPGFWQRGSTLTGAVLGLLLGVLVAVGAALYINFGSSPFRKTEPVSPEAAPSKAPEVQSAPLALPGKPGDARIEKPQFDFYQILPGGEAAAPAPAQPSATTEAQPEKVYLQVGAFHDPSEADNLKARLALMGVEASVQRSETADKGVLHRVRVGPFSGAAAADAVKARLAQEGLESNLVRVDTRSAAASVAKP